jgi:hypothetical protein
MFPDTTVWYLVQTVAVDVGAALVVVAVAVPQA